MKKTIFALALLSLWAGSALAANVPQLSYVTGVNAGGTGLTSLGSASQCLQVNGAGTALTYGSCSAGSGTVTSVTFTGDGTVLSSTPSSAVTTSGTLTAALANAGANTLLGNNTGSSAAPGYQTSFSISGSGTAAGFTATPAANTNGITITGATDTTSNKLLNITETWNAAGTTFDAPIFLSVTNSAANSASKLIDIQAGASGTTSEFYVQTTGNTTAAGNITSNAGNYFFGNAAHAELHASGANSYFWGTGNSATPTALVLSTENVLSGTSNTAGASVTFNGSQSTGTGAGGSINFAVSLAGTTGTSVNALSNALTISGGGDLQLAGAIPTTSAGTVATGSTSNKGQITGLSAATTDTITFNTNAPLSTAPSCAFTGSAALASPAITAISTTAVTITMTAFTGTLYYVCF